MTKPRKGSAGLWLISAGMIFLSNPCINIIDVLPDVIGILLILAGIRKYADLLPGLYDAKRNFEKAAWVSLAGFFAMFFAPSADDFTKLSLAMAVWLLECIFLIPAMKNLFCGTDDLRIRLTDRGDEATFSGAAAFSSVFLVVRSVAAVLPLCMPLFFEKKEEDIVTGGSATDVGSVIRVMTVICAAVSLVIGIAWLVSSIKCMKILGFDAEFVAAAEEKYNSEIRTDVSLRRKRCVRRFWTASAAAVPFLLGVSFGGKPFAYEFMFGAVTALAVLFGNDVMTLHRKRIYALCGVFCALSATAAIFGYLYAEKFGAMIYPYEADGFLSAFLPYALAETAAMATLVMTGAAVRRACCDMIEKCVGWRGDDSLSGARDAEIKKKLKGRVTGVFVIECIYAAVTAVATAASPFGEINTLFSMGWVLRLLLCAVMLVLCIRTGDGVISETEK